jgi:hypothetical protein
MRVTLEKELIDEGMNNGIIKGATGEIGESSYVNLSTASNITFSKGLVTKRENFFKPYEITKPPHTTE